MTKIRIDKLILDLGLAPSRERAKAYIMAGKVLVHDQVVDKPGALVDVAAPVRLKGVDQPYVSRGGVKLKGAIDFFQVDIHGLICLDIGASTGGFTDCLLQEGAAYVFAVDVGTNQLHWSLRQNPKVLSLEQTNFRYLELAQLGSFVDLIVIDVSFISLTKILEKAASFLCRGGRVLALVKPQFEAGKERVQRGGLVKDEAVRQEVVQSIQEEAQALGLQVLGVEASAIQGKKSGNQEYLLYLQKP